MTLIRQGHVTFNITCHFTGSNEATAICFVVHIFYYPQKQNFFSILASLEPEKGRAMFKITWHSRTRCNCLNKTPEKFFCPHALHTQNKNKKEYLFLLQRYVGYSLKVGLANDWHDDMSMHSGTDGSRVDVVLQTIQSVAETGYFTREQISQTVKPSVKSGTNLRTTL